MTYCVGILVKGGLAVLADTRTNAGVDKVSTYRKLQVFGNDGERLIAVATAGNLSTTQAALERAGREADSLQTAPSIHRAAEILGRALRATRDEMEALKQPDVNFDATLLVGGSVGGEPPRLFLVYGAGNFIECGEDTPYLQIGETQYGKPVLDRLLTYDTDLDEAVKIGLISYSPTLRSDLAVGLPIDLVTMRTGARRADLLHRIEADDGYFRDLETRWSEALHAAAAAIPPPPYGSSAAAPSPGLKPTGR